MNKIGTVILRAVTMLVLLLIFCILYKILKKGLPDYEIDAGGGIGPFLLNSIYVLLLSLAVSIPVGMLAGIFLAEYAPNNKFTEFIRMSVESLASVPSIVFGLFGYVLFVEVFHIGVTIIGAAITLGLLNLPLLTRITEESIVAVPGSLREGAYALGSTKAQTILRVVLPEALNGIITGISLTACRAFGESAVILLAGGTSTSGSMWDFHLTAQGGTLPVYLWYVQSEALVEDAKQIADRSAAVLILSVIVLTLLIRLPILIKKIRTK